MTNTYLLVAIKLHNHGNSPDYSISKGLIHSLSFKKQFFLQPFKKVILLFKGQIKCDFFGEMFFSSELLRAVFLS